MSLRIRVALTALALLAASPATADTVTVDCDGGPAPFNSVNDALGSFAEPVGHTIRIRGTCEEAINVYQWENLTLQGIGASAVLQPDPLALDQPVLHVGTSRGVFVSNVTFRGDPGGTDIVRIFDSVDVDLGPCTVEDGPTGVFIRASSSVVISDTTLRNLTDIAVRAEGSSTVDLMGEPFSSGTTVVENSGLGIQVQGAVFNLLGTTRLSGNLFGVSLDSGRLFSCCGEGLHVIENNDVGIFVDAGDVELRGPLRLTGNLIALWMWGGSATLSDALLQGNGEAGGDLGAIVAIGNSLVRLVNSTVRDSLEHGIAVFEGADVRLAGGGVRNNAVDGLVVDRVSIGRVLLTTTVTGNGNLDLRCENDSKVFGDPASFGTMDCPGFVTVPSFGHEERLPPRARALLERTGRP